MDDIDDDDEDDEDEGNPNHLNYETFVYDLLNEANERIFQLEDVLSGETGLLFEAELIASPLLGEAVCYLQFGD